MEPFEIVVDYNGLLHHLRVVPHPEDPEFEVYQDDKLLAVLRNECDDRGDYWCTSDAIDTDFVDKIGERIEKHDR